MKRIFPKSIAGILPRPQPLSLTSLALQRKTNLEINLKTLLIIRFILAEFYSPKASMNKIIKYSFFYIDYYYYYWVNIFRR